MVFYFPKKFSKPNFVRNVKLNAPRDCGRKANYRLVQSMVRPARARTPASALPGIWAEIAALLLDDGFAPEVEEALAVAFCEPETVEDAAWLAVPVWAPFDTLLINYEQRMDQDAIMNTYAALVPELDAAWAPRTKRRAKAAMADLIILDNTFCQGGMQR